MAQRMVHAVFGECLADACQIADKPRFLLGSLLPDALADRAQRDASHFAARLPDGARYYDFERFRSDFSAQIAADDPFYLGYYGHLVEDSFYRSFCHRDYDLYFVSDEQVRDLHRDYHLLNPYLKERYGLTNRLRLPDGLSSEPVLRIARFDPEGLLRDLDSDLAEQPEGRFRYLSPAMMDSFISRYLPLCEQELRAVRKGEVFLRAADMAWINPHR